MDEYYEDILLAWFMNKIYSFDDNFAPSFSSEKNSFSFDNGTCTGYDFWSTVPGSHSINGQQNQGIIMYFVDSEPGNFLIFCMFEDSYIDFFRFLRQLVLIPKIDQFFFFHPLSR